MPKGRWPEGKGFFRAIQAHHHYHHVYYRWTLNVVLPIADFVLGTRGVAEAGLYERLEGARKRRREKGKEPTVSRQRPETNKGEGGADRAKPNREGGVSCR